MSYFLPKIIILRICNDISDNFAWYFKDYDINLFIPIDQLIPLQTVKIQMRWLILSHLIRIYTVCLSVFDFRLKPLFATIYVSKFTDGRVHVRNLGVKGLVTKYFVHIIVYKSNSNCSVHTFVYKLFKTGPKLFIRNEFVVLAAMYIFHILVNSTC